jgi:hypothetical protein
VTHIYIKPSSNQRSTTSREASAAGRLRPNALLLTGLANSWMLGKPYLIALRQSCPSLRSQDLSFECNRSRC